MRKEDLNRELSEILDEAKHLVTKDRAGTHGNAIKTLETLASLWRVYLYHRRGETIYVSASDVAEMLCMLKLARKCTGAFHRDNYADTIGYAAIAYAAAKWENENEN
jgi:hypothetical protein